MAVHGKKGFFCMFGPLQNTGLHMPLGTVQAGIRDISYELNLMFLFKFGLVWVDGNYVYCLGGNSME